METISLLLLEYRTSGLAIDLLSGVVSPCCNYVFVDRAIYIM
jgi:hypothetical protein